MKFLLTAALFATIAFGCTALKLNPNSRVLARKVVSFIGSAGVVLGLATQTIAENAPDAPTPQLYGLKKGRLLTCKSKSNCISSSAVNSLEHYGRPWAYDEEPDAEYKKILRLLSTTDFSLKVVEQDDEKRYVRAEAKSVVPITGTDDMEFLINPLDKIITYRSNSRDVVKAGPEVLGDGGSHKNRLDAIRRKLGVKEMGVTAEVEDFVKKEEKLSLLGIMNAASQPSEINFIDNSVGPNINEKASE